MGDFTWGDMPEELAGLLYEIKDIGPTTRMEVVHAKVNPLLEWVNNEMVTCAATSEQWLRIPTGRCRDLPVPGSEFCPLHMPAEETGDNG